MKDEFDVVNSCYARMCHPETCGCQTPFVVRKNDFIIKNVCRECEGEEYIEKLKSGEEVLDDFRMRYTSRTI
jgi:hypothetical protein